KAEKGKIRNFPGFDIDYEPPLNGVLKFDISKIDAKNAAKQIYDEVSKSI
ncbi:MAG: adenylyl-sulfate kinase, partial [Chlorobi bacterium]|nr:adenylyl-sulfate kinase [Chlorobiota bacterium]